MALRAARKVVARPSIRSTPRVPPREPPSAAHLLAEVRVLFPLPDWAVIAEVSAEDPELEVLRRADAIAVYTHAGARWRFVGFEVKRSRADLRRELRHLAKSRAHVAICDTWYIVVPAPWKDYLLTLDELPPTWGLMEVGTGGARIVLPAAARDVEPPPQRFLCALFRAAAAAGERLAPGDAVDVGAPLKTVARYLSRGRAALVCRHIVEHVPRPKRPGPLRVPCFSCAEGLPPDLEAILAGIGDATADELDVIDLAVQARRVA